MHAWQVVTNRITGTLPRTGTLPPNLQRWMKQNATRRGSTHQRTETLQGKGTPYVLPTWLLPRSKQTQSQFPWMRLPKCCTKNPQKDTIKKPSTNRMQMSKDECIIINHRKQRMYLGSKLMANSIRGPMEAPWNRADAIKRETLFCCQISEHKIIQYYPTNQDQTKFHKNNQQLNLPLHVEKWQVTKTCNPRLQRWSGDLRCSTGCEDKLRQQMPREHNIVTDKPVFTLWEAIY